MKRLLTLFLGITIVLSSAAQGNAYLEEIKKHREKENADFLNPDKSPLSGEKLSKFEGHEFFPIDVEYRVVADFVATPEAKPFALGTNRGTTQLFKKHGDLNFELKGKKLTLEVYKQVRQFYLPTQKTYLFLPIIDQTTGVSTYDAGRYLHYEGIPKGNKWVIDFNKLYNPLCAYNERYECPMVPEANHLPIAIEAGIKGS